MSGKFKPAQVVQALQDTKGLVSLAAKRLRCDPDTVRNYAKRYPIVAQALQEEREAMTDVAELALYKKIQEGEGWAVCFYLKTQGKERGYVETMRNEHTGADGGPLRVTFRVERRDDAALPAPSDSAAIEATAREVAP